MYDGPSYADPTIVGNGDVRAVQYGSDAGLFVEFRMENVHLEFQSEQEGHPIYEARPFIRIYVPGDKTKMIDREVRMTEYSGTPSDPDRFPRQWQAFKAGAAAVATGFPLAEWPMVTASQVRELNGANIWTLEQLAEVTDANLGTLGHGGRLLRDKAKARVDSMHDDSVLAKMAASNADLQRQLDELKASFGSPDAEIRRGPGRPRKEESDAS